VELERAGGLAGASAVASAMSDAQPPREGRVHRHQRRVVEAPKGSGRDQGIRSMGEV